MKVLGIITEYNPFHNGHRYHIDEAKKITGADYVIAVMSGDFVQRGAPAIASKYDRTIMALNNGVDLVFELPVYYATGSAQYFALGAVRLLNSLGIVNYLCFGSECGDISILKEAAQLFSNPTKGFQACLYSFIREGLTYPAARAKAAKQILDTEQNTETSKMLDIISEPNNILGIEYIKALLQLNSSIIPITLTRQQAHYHDETINNEISSATAIRNFLQDDINPAGLNAIRKSVPKSVYDYFSDNHYTTFPVTIEDFASIIKYKLLSESPNKLSKYLDLSSDIAARIKNIDISNYSISELSQKIKTKNITLTRVNRALLHVLLNINKDILEEFISDDIIYYARLLGIKKEASHLIRIINEYGKLPVITKVSIADKQLNSLGMKMLNKDIFATHLYNQAIYDKYKTLIPNEYKHGICLL